jgi:hypothetical protein
LKSNITWRIEKTSPWHQEWEEEKKKDTHTQILFWCQVWMLEMLMNNHKGVETSKEI